MSFSILWLFVHTPVPYIPILCLVFYRHDLSQLAHPFKDQCSLRDWKFTFQDLGMSLRESPTAINSSKEAKRLSSIRVFLSEASEKYPNARFYLAVAAIIACSSVLSSVVLGVFFDSRFSQLFSSVLQLCSSLPSIPAMQRCFGSFPSPHCKYHLKSRRTGSLLRYQELLGRPVPKDDG